jgi:transcription-repair coupling factor (superfamily II helicase)
MATLAALVHDMPAQFVLLTTLSAATQRVPARTLLREAAFKATVGNRIDEDALRGFLVRMGFT